MKVPRWLRHCANCKEETKGCLCPYCLRVALVPLLLAEIVHWMFR